MQESHRSSALYHAENDKAQMINIIVQLLQVNLSK